jgi:hypothetical protein
MRIIGAIFFAAIIVTASLLLGHALHVQAFVLASLVVLGFLLAKSRPRWAAIPAWLAVLAAQWMVAAGISAFFRLKIEGGLLILWPVLSFLLWHKGALSARAAARASR